MQWLSVADMDKPEGTVTYTQLCNERGGIECDLTMTRLGEHALVRRHRLCVRCPRHGMDPLELARRRRVQIRDLTSAHAVINLCGPMARDVLQAVCDDDVSNDDLPIRHRT